MRSFQRCPQKAQDCLRTADRSRHHPGDRWSWEGLGEAAAVWDTAFPAQVTPSKLEVPDSAVPLMGRPGGLGRGEML